MDTKLSQLKAAWASGDRTGALRIAAKFPNLGDQADDIRRGWDAYQNPKFYRQIGKNPKALTGAALIAVATRYKLEL